MVYLITFLEGILSFLSPCMLPMLPVYLSFFAGRSEGRQTQIGRILAFILGFTLCFLLLGTGFAALGGLLNRYRSVVNLICGGMMAAFGLSFLDIVPLPFFKGVSARVRITGVLSAFLFGVIYSLSLTPCVGAFLGSALLLATTSGSMGQGALMLLVYSLGMGIPFLLSALLASHLDVLFSGIKAHYSLLNRICGGFLIAVGLLTAFGWMNALISLLR